MSRSVLQPSQQKLAEKLTILNDRGVGMLTRLYNIKKPFKPGGKVPAHHPLTWKIKPSFSKELKK